MAKITATRRALIRTRIAQLAKKYPAFRKGKEVVPLKIGIYQDLQSLEPGLSEKELSEIFLHYCWTYYYKLALTQKIERYDLFMNPAGTVGEPAKQYAQHLLETRYCVKKENKPKVLHPPQKPLEIKVQLNPNKSSVVSVQIKKRTPVEPVIVPVAHRKKMRTKT